MGGLGLALQGQGIIISSVQLLAALQDEAGRVGQQGCLGGLGLSLQSPGVFIGSGRTDLSAVGCGGILGQPGCRVGQLGLALQVDGLLFIVTCKADPGAPLLPLCAGDGDLTQSLQNFAINSAALAIFGFLVYRDWSKEQADQQQIKREEELGKLQVRREEVGLGPG